MFSTIFTPHILQDCKGKHHIFQNIRHMYKSNVAFHRLPQCSVGLEKKESSFGLHCKVSLLVDALSFGLSFLLS